jgi:hypothetical protein
MNKTCTDPARVAVWVSMADHFLDTETRHDLPRTALCCVEAGLSAAEARHVWQHEVSPAVGFNLFSGAGEWAGWDRDWLLARIARARLCYWHRPGTWLSLRWPMPLMGGQWLAIERCIEFLQAFPGERTRQTAANDLTRLARHLFDFGGKDLSTLEPREQQRVRALYPAPFNTLLRSALMRSERKEAEARVQRALAEAAR